jgi:hypothetical protein
MRRVSGIRFADERFLQEFEREAKRRLAPEEAKSVLKSYSVHELADSVVLEFRDMAAVATFLEKARAVDLAGRTFRVVKLISAVPTPLYRLPASDADRWAKERIEQVANEGRQDGALILGADVYERLAEDFKIARIPLEEYIR